MSCPPGFVIPDEPDNPLTSYPNRTLSDCAFSCASYPVYDENEYSYLYAIRPISFGVNLGLTSIVLFYHGWRWFKTRQNEHTRYALPSFLMLLYGCVIVVCSMLLLIIESFGPSRLCANNANPMDGHSGFSLCSAEAGLTRVTYGTCITCFCYYSMESFHRTMLGYRGTLTTGEVVWKYAFIFGMPLLGSIIGVATGTYRFALGFQGCGVTVPTAIDNAVFQVPSLLALAVGELSLAVICGKIIYLTAIGQLSSFFAAVRMVGTAFKFICLIGGFLLTSVMIAFSMQNDQHNRVKYTEEWGLCVITNYDGITTASYVDVCGAHPKRMFGAHELGAIVIFSTVGLSVTYFFVNIKWCGHYNGGAATVDPSQLPVSVSRETMPQNALPAEFNLDPNGAVKTVFNDSYAFYRWFSGNSSDPSASSRSMEVLSQFGRPTSVASPGYEMVSVSGARGSDMQESKHL